jgi:hypothetical protein
MPSPQKRSPNLKQANVGKSNALHHTKILEMLRRFEVKDGISWFWIGTHAEYDKLIG